MALGERIRQSRQHRGLTQEQLAGREFSKSFISLLERGVAKPSVDTLLILAQRLGTSVDSLLGSAGHLPDHVAMNLLTLSAEAIQQRRLDFSSHLLSATRFIAESYVLAEPMREVLLQEVQLALERRDYELTAQKITEGLRQCEVARDRWRTGRALVLQGRLQLVRRELNEAVRTFEQALGALRQARASRDPARAEALIFLGTTLAYLGKHDLATKRYAEAADAQATRHVPLLQGRASWGLGMSYRRLGSLDLAAEHLNRAKETFEKIEELPDLAGVLLNIGQLAYQQKRFGDALHCFTHALRITERLSLKITRASTLTEIAKVHLATSNLDDATAVAEQALKAAQDAQDPMETAEVKTVLAAVCARTGRTDRAKELMAEALAAFRTRGAHARIAQTARDLGQTFIHQGAKADAADQLLIALEAEEALREQTPSQAT